MKSHQVENNAVLVATVPQERLDAATSKDFKNLLAEALNKSNRVVLNLENVRFVDSMGLGVLVGALKRASSAGGDLKLCAASAPVRSLLQLTLMHRVFGIYNTPEEAVAAFSS